MKQTSRSLILSATILTATFGTTTAATAQSSRVTEVEVLGGAAINLEGSRAFVGVFDGRSMLVADSGEHKTLPSVGFAMNVWRRKTVGTFLDLSYVDGGTASATLGSSRSEVSSRMFDFHGGVLIQYPGGRVRPYGAFGGGFARISTQATLSSIGVTESVDGGQWLSSLTFGGGVRLMLSENFGVKVGLEAVTAVPVKAGAEGSTKTYGRFMLGTVYSSGKM